MRLCKTAVSVEHRRHVVWVDAQRVADQNAGNSGYVVVGAVNDHRQAVGNATVK